VHAVEIDDLVVRYGDRTAVDGISLYAGNGEVTAVLGRNGAGKTTTVETAEGYRRPARGSVRVLGLDPLGDRRRLVGSLGVMLQRGGVHPRMTPREATRLFASYYPRPADPDGVLRRVGLEEVGGTPWRHLSGGEQQRLSLALALVARPKVAFLDEPTAGVDPVGRQVIRQIVRDLRDEGTCVVLTTHELDEAERLADRVVIIDHGHILAAGSPTELMIASGGDIRFAAPPGLDVGSLATTMSAAVEESQPGEYRVAAAATPRAVADLTAWLAEQDLPLADLRAGRGRLEDLFIQLVTSPTPTQETDETGGRGHPPAGRRRRR
jgi:ABC-2 type transport system ATP-binding protein